MSNINKRSLSLQSKKWFAEALKCLMQNKKYSEITIMELSKKAGLDRKTFYRNFETKEDVIRFYLDGTCQDYIFNLKQESQLTTYSIAKAYFSTCKMHSDFLYLLDKNNLLPLLLITFDSYLPILHRMFENEQTKKNPVYYSEYALSFFTGGFWNISVKWIRNGGKETPEEMAQIVENLMCHSL